MFDRMWDAFVHYLTIIGLPLVCAYHAVCGNIFLNTSAEDAAGLEKIGNYVLTPVQYLLAGKEAIRTQDGWVIKQRFDYETYFWPKSIASTIAFPLSLIAGSAIKYAGFLSKETSQRHLSLKEHFLSTEVQPHLDAYKKLNLSDLELAEFFPSQGYERRPGDEHHMHQDKECLQEITKLLTQANIPWWVDCGTLLGTYRYGGVIPWDYDIDIALLILDFENVRRVLNQLDPAKYTVQDWSSRTFPDSFFKVYIKETKSFIDLYFYEIDEEKQELRYIFSLETNMFFPEWWKKDERRFKKPVAFDVVFPLKKSSFDGIEVFIPNQPAPFLQRYYGENLAPAKVYNAKTNTFEKDLSHPYWQSIYVH